MKACHPASSASSSSSRGASSGAGTPHLPPVPGASSPKTPLQQAHSQGCPPSRVLTVDDDLVDDDADDRCPERATLSPQPRACAWLGSLPFFPPPHAARARGPAGRKAAARGVYRANGGGGCTAPQPDHRGPVGEAFGEQSSTLTIGRGQKWSASHFGHNTGAQHVPRSRPCATDHALWAGYCTRARLISRLSGCHVCRSGRYLGR